MRAVLDACVLYPTVLRQLLLATAEAGFFTPLWSARILEEWARAVERNSDGADSARAEIALLRDRWPEAELTLPEGAETGFHLPDPNDTHVLAAAVLGQAEALVTLNIRDFPLRALTPLGVQRRDPDGLFLQFLAEDPDRLIPVVNAVHRRTEAAAGRSLDLRWLMKKALVPRLGKALTR